MGKPEALQYQTLFSDCDTRLARLWLHADPSVLFCDEPTSGLDARAALLVMRVLRKVAQADRTVISTIHQPSAVIFEMFDSLLLLKKGGYTVYNGSLGTNSGDLIRHFESNGAPPIASHENPANYMLNALGAGVAGAATEQVDFAKVWENCPEKKELDDVVYQEIQPRPGDSSSFMEFPDNRKRATTVFYQFTTCLTKLTTTYYRSPAYNLKRMIVLTLLGLLFGLTYLYSGDVFPIETVSQARSVAALVYLCMDFIGILALITVLPITFSERTVYYRERAAQMYSPWVYSLSMFLVEIPYLIASVFVFTAIMYFLVGFHASQFGAFFLIFYLYIALCTFLGQMFAVASPNEVVGQICIGFTTVIFNLVSGYLVAPNLMPDVVYWLYWVSPSGYAFNALASITLAYCPTDRASDDEYIGCSYIIEKNLTVAEYAISTFDLNTDHTYQVDVPALVGYIVLSVLITALCLRYVTHDTK